MSGSSRRWRNALYLVGSVLAILIIAAGGGWLMTAVMAAEGAPLWVANLIGIVTSGALGYPMGRAAGFGWELTEGWRHVH